MYTPAVKLYTLGYIKRKCLKRRSEEVFIEHAQPIESAERYNWLTTRTHQMTSSVDNDDPTVRWYPTVRGRPDHQESVA